MRPLRLVALLAALLAAPAAAQGPLPAPVSRWSFDEAGGSAVLDATGTGNTGALVGIVTRVPGLIGNAVRFDGPVGRVEIPSSPSLVRSGGHVTFEAVVYVDGPAPAANAAADGLNVIAAKTQSGFHEYGFFLQSGTATVVWTVADDGGNGRLAAPAPLSLKRWHHLLGTYDGDLQKLYVDGALVASAVRGPDLLDGSGPVVVGDYAALDFLQGPIFGTVDVAAVYDEPVDAATARALAQAALNVRGYVSNLAGASVSVIDPATGSLLATIPVGAEPHGVALTPDGTRAYVANFADDTVSVIDTRSNMVVGTLFGFSGPVSITIAADGSRVYVASRSGDFVTVLDAATNGVLQTVLLPPGSRPSFMALSPDGDQLWVTHELDAGISIVDTATYAVTSASPPGPAAEIALASDGARAYATGFFHDQLWIIDTLSLTTLSLPVGVAPHGVALTPDGARAYVANRGTTDLVPVLSNNTVSVIDTATATVLTTISAGLGFGPESVAISPDGTRVYVTALFSDSVSVIDTASNTVVGTIPVGAMPAHIALGPAAALAPPPPVTTGAILGHVRDNFGNPIGGATVQLNADLVGGTYATVTTAVDGSYAFSGVIPGTYRVSAQADGYATQWYNGKSVHHLSDHVGVTAGATTSGIDFALVAGAGGIGGRVTDGAGNGLAGVPVSIHLATGGYVLSALTDAAGYYTTGLRLGPGFYKAQVDTNGFVQQWYSGAATFDTASAIPVSGGSVTPGVDFALAGGAARIAGTVTLAGSGAPLAGIQIDVLDAATSAGVAGAQTGPDGTYATNQSLALGPYLVRASGPGVEPQTLGPFMLAAGTTLTVDFVMAPGGTITGTVRRAADFAPVAGAIVEVYDAVSGLWVAGSFITQADGSYATTGLAPGQYKVRARTLSGLAARYYVDSATIAGATPVTVSAGATTPGVDFALAAGGGIVGTVTSGATPLGAVSVEVYDFATNAWLDAAQTAPDGTYTFERRLAPGAYKVRARAAGYATQFSNGAQAFNAAAGVVVAAAVDTPVNFDLTPGRSITGTVRSSGIPLAGALIGVYDSNNQWVEGFFTSGADGTYTTEGRLKGGVSYKVQAQLSGYATQVYNGQRAVNAGTLVAVGATDVGGIDFALVPGGGFTGTVRDTFGNAIAGAIVDLFDAVSGAFLQGGFVTRADGTYDTGRLLTGSYKVKARVVAPQSFVDTFHTTVVDGSGLDLRTATTVTAVAGTDLPSVDIALPPGGRIAGTIRTRGSGLAIANALVVASRLQANNFSGTFSTRTDATGAYELRGLRDGEWVLRVEAAGHQVGHHSGSPDATVPDNAAATPIKITGAGTVSAVDLNLAPGGGSISGRVTRIGSGTPVPTNTQVQALIGAGSVFPRANFVTGAGTDGNGNYTISGLPPGQYLVQAASTGATAVGWYPTEAISAASAFSVTVTDGATTAGIDFAVPTSLRTISGTVRDTSGNPIRFGTVGAVNPFFQFTIRGAALNGDGTYTIGGLPPGKYLVRATTETTYEQRMYPDETVVPAGTPVDVTVAGQSGIDLVLPATGSTIAGRVLTLSDPDNPLSPLVPVPGVQVSVRNFTDNNAGSAITQLDGTYLVRGVPPGEYKLRMQNGPDTLRTPHGPGFTIRYYTASGTGAAIFDDASFVHVDPGSTVTGIDLTVAPATGRITGTVTAEDTGAAVVNGAVAIRESTSGAIVGTAVTRADGTFVVDNLAPGSYKLRASAPGFAAQWWSGQDTREAADEIAVAAGTVGGVDFVLTPSQAAFSGFAFDTASQPLRDVAITLYDAATFGVDADGLVTGFVTGVGVTDSQGRFVADNIKPGSYLALARALGYARVYHGQRPDAASAALFPITVTSPPGPDAPSVTFTMTRTSDVRGTISYTGPQVGALRIGLFCDPGLTERVYGLVVPSPVFPQAYQFGSPAPDTRGLLPAAVACPASEAYFVAAFVDSTPNGARDATEPAGAVGGVPLAENATASGTDLTLTDPAVTFADVSITKTAFPIVPILLGGQLTYTLTVGNAGPGIASGIALSDPLPAGTAFAAISVPQGVCVTPPVGEPGTVSCALGALVAGASKTVTLTVATTATGSIDNTATVTTTSTDPNGANNSASAPASVFETGRITGRVTATDGVSPIAGAFVEVFDAGTGAWVAGGIVTAGDGTYTTGELTPGQYKVRASASIPGLAATFYAGAPNLTLATAVTVTTGATTPNVDIALAAGGGIVGTVSSGGTAIAFAGIEVYDATTGFWVDSTQTSTDGLYTFSQRLAPGTYRVRARASGYATVFSNGVQAFSAAANVLVAAGADTTVDFNLTAGRSITGTVASGGVPLQGAWITVFDANNQWVEGVASAADGTYTTEGRLLPDRSYKVQAQLDGYVTQVYNGQRTLGAGTLVAVGTTDVAGIDFSLAQGGGFKGTVRDTNGTPIGGAIVDLFDPVTGFFLAGGLPTAADGTYDTGRILGGAYKVKARVPAPLSFVDTFHTTVPDGSGVDLRTATTVTAVAGQDVLGVDIAMPPGGRISGTIRTRGTLAPIANASVFVGRVAASNFSGAFFVRTDAAGTFEVRGLRDGEWTVRVEAAGHMVGYSSGVPDAPGPDGGVALPIAISGAGTVSPVDLHLTPGGGRISGRVTRSGGGAVPAGTQIQALIGAGSMYPRGNFVTGVGTDGNGNYTISGLPPGVYTLQAVGNQFANGTAMGWYPTAATSPASAVPVTVVDGATTAGVDFSVLGLTGGASPRTISGTVRDVNGNPIRFGTVVAIDPFFQFGIRGTALNGDGTYTIPTLPPGRYLVRAQTETTYEQRMYPDETVVPAGSLVDVTAGNQVGIDLALPATAGTIQGRVMTPSDPANPLSPLVPVPGVQVSARSFFDNNVGSAITRLDGTYLIRALAPGDYIIRMQNGPDTVREPAGPGFAIRYYTASGTGAAIFDDASFVHVAAGQSTTDIDLVLAPATASLAGTVTVQGTGAPVVGGAVSIREAASGAAVAVAVTRADGSFLANNLAPGSYMLRASAPGYAAQWSFGKDTLTAADAITVTTGAVSNANFVLTPSQAAFTGRAFATDGEPLRNVGIVLFDAATFSLDALGRTTGFVTGTNVTDSQGRFIATNIKPGAYVAQARALGYARVFAGGRPDAAGALLSTITVTSPPDPDAPAVNFNMALTADIQGAIANAGTQTGALRIGLFCDATLVQPVYTLAIPAPSFPQAYQFGRPGPDTRGLLPSSLACPVSQQYFVGAYVDTNSNGVQDATEPSGTFDGATAVGVAVAEGATLVGRDFALVEDLGAGGTTTTALAIVSTYVPAGGGLATLGDIRIDEHGARALSTAGRIRVTLPGGLAFSMLPVVSTGPSWGLGIVQTGPDAPRLESSGAVFSFALASRSSGGAASIIVSGMLVTASTGFVPDGAAVPVSVAVDASLPNGLTPESVQVAIFLAPPPDPVFTGIAIDSNAAGLGVTRTVVLNGLNFGQLDFTNSDLSLRDTIDFGPGITVIGAPSVSPDGKQITVTIQVDPNADAGPRTVSIIDRGPDGQQTIITATLPGGGSFSVDPLPVVTAAGTGETGAGPLFADLKKQTLYVGGSNFRPPTTTPSNLVVQVGGGGITVDPTSVVFLSDMRLAVEVDVAAGADALSPRTVTVTNPDLGTTTSAAILAIAPRPPDAPEGLPAPKNSGSSTSTTPPSLSSISPAAARTGASVTISGTNLGSATASKVTFTAANNAKVTVSPTSGGASSLAVLVPATAVDGPVTVANGTLQSSNSLAFTVTNPRPSGVSPGSAFQGDTLTLDVTGTKFQSGMTVQLSPSTGATLGAVIFVDATRVRIPVTLAANAPTGLRSVVVTNPDGGTATLANAFEVKLRSATTMTLALRRADGTPLDVPAWLPSVDGVSVTLDATGRCTAKTVTPTLLIVEAQLAGTSLPPQLTFTITPSAIKGTAANEDCEIDPVTLLPTAVPTNDFGIGQVTTMPSLTAPLSVTVGGANGVYQAQLASWDWGGKVRIEVTDSPTSPTVAGSLRLPVDADGDDLPDVYETNLVAGVDNADATGVNVLDAGKQDQNANGLSDRDDRFARDGLTNFEKYRGVYLRGPLNGTASGPMLDHVRLGAGKRNLFVRGRGFSTDPNVPAGSCGVDNTGRPIAQDAALLARFPCPAFEVGDAYRELGIRVWDVAASFTGASVLPTKSYADPTKPTLDLATVTYDAVNCAGGQTCDHSGKTGIRQWQFPTLGYSTFGSATTYGDARVFARAVKGYFTDRPYLHQENLTGKYLPMATTGGVPMLAPVTTVCDSGSGGSDNGVADSGECKDADGLLGGDVFVAGQFSLSVSAMDVNNDDCVELPFVADPTTLTACDARAASASGPQATFRQVVRAIVTHELGHALGVNVHTTDVTDVMYQYSINWTRDNHFSSQAGQLIQVHNKGLQ
ncbi:MAG: hypothetical protein A3G44_16850 [Candidatus Rokubacteria bacterium RIFCSPLOWO2_12_FULL_73_47]|nr:MAG: hypothetical protein A3G44_16850 [Candidatus Rokubacteria bacterium RIFCSPLOWO2_12_FULL_73_47]